MNGFRAWIADFMRGRYGYDEYSRHLGILVIVLIIVSIVLGVVASLLYTFGRLVGVGVFLSMVSNIVNWVSMALLLWTFYRMFSRRHDKRRAENERYLARRAKRQQKRAASGREGRDRGQEMYRGAGQPAGRPGPGGYGPGAPGAGGYGAAPGPGAYGAGAYDYLSCPFCGQRMRVPAGRGKLAVKCPSCGEKTIINS